MKKYCKALVNLGVAFIILALIVFLVPKLLVFFAPFVALLLEAEIANIDIGWHVNTCQVTDVHTTVGIRQSRSHGSTFKVLLFHIS